MKSGNLNFLEPSGPLQACNGTALPFVILKCTGFEAVGFKDVNRSAKAQECVKKNDFIHIRMLFLETKFN